MLTIRDINEENFAKVVGLQIDEQDKKFVASVEKSLANVGYIEMIMMFFHLL